MPWLLHGLALALLPWMHTRFAVLAATLGGLVLLRLARTTNPLANAIAFLAPPAVSALGWLFFFAILYGAPDPSAPYGGTAQNSLAYFPDGIGGLLFDQGFGLLATAPAIAVALGGLARTRRTAVEWVVVTLPYLVTVATFAMWWAGSSGPARFLVPVLLPLAIPAACAWAAFTSPWARRAMLMTLAAGIWMTTVMAGGGDGRLGYHTRNETGPTPAPWIEWANHVVDLPAALPSFVPQPLQPDPGGLVSRAQAARSGFAVTLVWIVCLGAAGLAGRVFARRCAAVEATIAAAVLSIAVAAMIAMTIAWKLHDAEPLTVAAAQMELLRRLAHERVAVADLTGWRRLPRAEVSTLRVAVAVSRRAGPRLNRPVAVFPAVPAGSYELAIRRNGAADGWIMVGVGDDQFAIATQPVAAYDAGVRLELPVDVRALIVRADEGARDQLQSIELRPMTLAPAAAAGAVARRAVRYGNSALFFLDDRAYPEPLGFWVGGRRDAVVAMQLDHPAATFSVMVRNAAVGNTVVLEAGSWREQLALSAGEERRVDVPVEAATGSGLLRIRSDSGFRPSDVDPGSRDTRLLGVYLRPL